ncbi:hypothetical protein ACVWWG_003626 [Bradyrhizobium sp. LB7.2]
MSRGKVALERLGPRPRPPDTMAMFKKSVSSLLLTLMALLAAGALASTAIQMVGAFGRYSDSLETARLAAADKAIFHGVLALRNNRGDAQSAILGEDDPRTKLEAAEKAEQVGYDAIGAALATVDFARRDELAGTLKQRWSDAAPQFQLFYDEAKRPRAERKIERTSSWYDAVTKVIETANLASTAVSNRAWTDDPYIARMIQVRRFAWQVRDRYGIHCSSLRSNVNSSKPLDDAQKRSVAQWDGTIASGWAGMGELLAAPGVTAELVTAATDAKAKTDGVLKQIGELTKNFDGSGKPALPASEWNTLCQSPFPSIVAVANKALDQSIARAETVQAKALTNLVVQSLAFLLALAVTLAGVYVVRNRLMRPVRANPGRHRQDQRPRLRHACSAIQTSRRVRHHGGRARKPARECGDRGTPGPGTRIAAGAPARPLRHRRCGLPQLRRHRASRHSQRCGVDERTRCHRDRRALAGFGIEQPDRGGLLLRRAGHQQSRDHRSRDRGTFRVRWRDLRAGAGQRPRGP